MRQTPKDPSWRDLVGVFLLLPEHTAQKEVDNRKE